MTKPKHASGVLRAAKLICDTLVGPFDTDDRPLVEAQVAEIIAELPSASFVCSQHDKLARELACRIVHAWGRTNGRLVSGDYETARELLRLLNQKEDR